MYRVLVAALIGLAILPGFIASAAAQGESADDLVREVNEYRAAQGMPPLAMHDSLMLAAQRHATWMAVNGAHSHQGEGGSMPQDRAAAAGYQGYVSENVAGGTLGWATVAWAVEGWAGSYGHRQTMLSNSAHIGAGIASNEEETLYVLLVGSTSTYAPAPRQTTPPKDEPTDLPAIAIPITVATPREDGAVVHIVQQGQTAWTIAARYGVPLDGLIALNHLDQDAILHPGDAIIVRLGEGQAPPPSPIEPATHIVKEGESLWTIAALYRLAVEDLLTLNGLQPSAVIHPGDALKLRRPDPTPPPTAPRPESPMLTPTISPTPSTATTVALQPTATPSSTPTPMSASVAGAQSEPSGKAILVIALIVALALGAAGGVIVMMLMKRRLR